MTEIATRDPGLYNADLAPAGPERRTWTTRNIAALWIGMSINIPTYTLGDAYEPHPTANQEIDGIMFPDMPWMLGDGPLSAEVKAAAVQAYGESGARRGRLFAFGFDALRIAAALQRGQNVPPQGLTGTLSMDAQGRVRRELEWVRMKGGVPTPLDAAPTTAATP